VNRGQRAPSDSGAGGAVGEGGAAGHVDAGHPDTGVDMGGAGGMNGQCVPDASVAGDAGDAGDAAVCDATFNFEGCGNYNAMLNTPDQQVGFKSFMVVGSPTFCGGGALALEAHLTPIPDAGETHKGEVYIDVPGAPIDLGGKTITFSALAVPPLSTATVYILPVSNTRGYGPQVKIVPSRTDWTTGSTSYTVGDPLVADVSRLAIQFISNFDNYNGTLYVDEINISPTPVDGGANDGPSDARPSDVRDGGTTDVPGDGRDAPAGG